MPKSESTESQQNTASPFLWFQNKDQNFQNQGFQSKT